MAIKSSIMMVLAVISSLSTNVFATPTSPAPALPDSCANPPFDNCSFYSTCIESKYHCGASGYPLSYGQKYCEKFRAERSTLSTKGQSWMVNTMHCLQLKLVPEATGAPGASKTCKDLEVKAFGTHAKCYVESGLCTLSPKDWIAIVDIVNFETLFSSWDAFKATLDAADGCLSFYAFLLKMGLHH
ncbi:hypothetical protein BD779DRAFT_1471176 [Infundibulicybe gibba]|nr:hypothetical protein BD779DRAFT_1471176 [Infundibulicybe gibba]